ncbi:MAG: isoaspartyl peptidase/L-asparaginase [Saprospiraceae bacterium]|nr:isoaspartyl peptidase/L-asparaginase [Saprospiraceae bacterium]
MSLHPIMMLPFIFIAIIGCESEPKQSTNTTTPRPEYVLVLHGGAGAIEKDKMTPEMDSAYRGALHLALDAGESVLASGGSAMDAIETAIIFLEDSPLFNAGKGAVFSYEGINELDASFMDGRTLSAGAIAGVTRIKNPVALARAVMEKSEHVFLFGSGAEEFALSIGLDTVDASYFFTERRWQNLQRAKILDKEKNLSMMEDEKQAFKYGTVGAVALDKSGNLAAATSTGGMTNKRWHRIGDAPVIGAGTYADNRACAVSCTGHGEYFIRYAIAHDLAARVRYNRQSPEEAGHYLIHEELLKEGGRGGLIALDTMGRFTMPFNTEGMYRGYVLPGKRHVAIYADE